MGENHLERASESSSVTPSPSIQATFMPFSKIEKSLVRSISWWWRVDGWPLQACSILRFVMQHAITLSEVSKLAEQVMAVVQVAKPHGPAPWGHRKGALRSLLTHPIDRSDELPPHR